MLLQTSFYINVVFLIYLWEIVNLISLQIMNKYICSYLLIFFCSCAIHINENDFWTLDKSDLEFIVSEFSPNLLDQKFNNSEDSLKLYEIEQADILNITKKHRYTWVALWRPFCSSDFCRNINYYSNVSEEFSNLDFKLILISETYNLRDIRKVVKNSTFTKPIFVLKNSYYGKKLRKNRVRFFDELNNNSIPKTKFGYSNLLFKDSTLIYAGDSISSDLIKDKIGFI